MRRRKWRRRIKWNAKWTKNERDVEQEVMMRALKMKSTLMTASKLMMDST